VGLDEAIEECLRVAGLSGKELVGNNVVARYSQNNLLSLDLEDLEAQIC
jgi:hypothetical protein